MCVSTDMLLGMHFHCGLWSADGWGHIYIYIYTFIASNENNKGHMLLGYSCLFFFTSDGSGFSCTSMGSSSSDSGAPGGGGSGGCSGSSTP